MNWEKWLAWNGKKYIAAGLFVVAYILTIPWRDYGFLTGFVDITEGVPIWAHLVVVVIGAVVLLILLKIVEIIVRKVVGH
jgi:hypothetical protein|tara:strand:- start:983 stop:1222 length:240 start_codon:yes stop_codon:yes gene_type:complete